MFRSEVGGVEDGDLSRGGHFVIKIALFSVQTAAISKPLKLGRCRFPNGVNGPKMAWEGQRLYCFGFVGQGVTMGSGIT